jgi:hypothetical protein
MSGTTISNLSSPGRGTNYDKVNVGTTMYRNLRHLTSNIKHQQVPTEGSVQYGQISDVKPGAGGGGGLGASSGGITYGALNDSGQTGGITYGALNDSGQTGITYGYEQFECCCCCCCCFVRDGTDVCVVFVVVVDCRRQAHRRPLAA